MTEPGCKLLLAKLEGVQRKSRSRWPTWNAICPCCKDPDRTFLLEYKLSRDDDLKLLGICNRKSCKARLSEVCIALDLRLRDVLANNWCLNREVGGLRIPPDPLPSPATVAMWMQNLEEDDEALAYLRAKRGLSDETIATYKIGLGNFLEVGGIYKKRYTLPVYEAGEIVNVRRYRPGATKLQGKMKGLQGRGIQLYPDVPDGSWVLLCEGEWDALVARQYGLPACTSTCGIDGWDNTWNECLRGRKVAIAYDCQDESRSAARRRAGDLRGFAAAVKVIDLGLGHKEDITDWFVSYQRTARELRLLIKMTPE